MCDKCVEWGGRRWHSYEGGYYERTDKSVLPKRTVRLHREVWIAARGPVPAGHDVHHRDHNRTNNALKNLECLPKGAHRRHHTLAKPIPRKDWSLVADVVLACADCGAELVRKRVTAEPRCSRCHSARAEAKRTNTVRSCRECGAEFRTRAGNFCSQRCVNLATVGGTVRVLPEGRGRA